MAVLKMGSHGNEVCKIQKYLADKQLYRGPIDGDFGGGTRAAVILWQSQNNLIADGIVGAVSWLALFGEEMKKPAIIGKPLNQRCLALTGSFETGKGYPECFSGLSGDFDGQGISLGVLQWNFGQGSLQPLLKEMMLDHPVISREVFGRYYTPFLNVLDMGKQDLLGFSRSVQHPVTFRVNEPWRGMARTLGRTDEFQKVQTHHASKVYKKSLKLCKQYDLWSERAVALMFDIVTQNGSIRNSTKQIIKMEINELPDGLSENDYEQKKLEIIANRRAEASNPRWIDDVRTRKLCIAQGKGNVHGVHYHLADQYGLELTKASDGFWGKSGGG